MTQIITKNTPHPLIIIDDLASFLSPQPKSPLPTLVNDEVEVLQDRPICSKLGEGGHNSQLLQQAEEGSGLGGGGKIGKFMKQKKNPNQVCWLTTHEG